MFDLIRAHPILSIIAFYAFCVVLLALYGYWRKRYLADHYTKYDDYTPYPKIDQPENVASRLADIHYHSGGIIPGGSPIPIILDRDHEHVLPLDHPVVKRMAMRNRFLATDDSSDAMVDQIVADQQQAHEEPGAEVTDPSVEPDATTFYHERVSIGAFTYLIGKDGFVSVSEAYRDGNEGPLVEVPEEWREPITTAAFEVMRLRDDQSVRMSRERAGYNEALDLAVMAMAFITRDRGTARIEQTLDDLIVLARKVDENTRHRLRAITDGI